MRMEYILEFVTLGRKLNFTKASSELFISQATLSRHLAAMEEELGEKLLFRDSHRVALTDAGKISLDYFSSIADTYTQYLSRISQIKNGTDGQLCIAEAYYAADRYLTDTLRLFKQRFPDISVDLLALQPYEIMQTVLDGKSDIGLTLLYDTELDKKLCVCTIYTEPIYAAMPCRHPLARRSKLHLPDLNGAVIASSRREHTFNQYVMRAFQTQNIHPKQFVYSQQADEMNATILSHDAIAIVPEHLKDIPHRGISFVRLDEKKLFVTIAYIYRADNQNPTLLRFLDLLRDQ